MLLPTIKTFWRSNFQLRSIIPSKVMSLLSILAWCGLCNSYKSFVCLSWPLTTREITNFIKCSIEPPSTDITAGVQHLLNCFRPLLIAMSLVLPENRMEFSEGGIPGWCWKHQYALNFNRKGVCSVKKSLAHVPIWYHPSFRSVWCALFCCYGAITSDISCHILRCGSHIFFPILAWVFRITKGKSLNEGHKPPNDVRQQPWSGFMLKFSELGA